MLNYPLSHSLVSPLEMNQSLVKEIYLRIIDATIEGSRAEINERGADDSAMESLNLLKSRWTTRLVHTHDFTDDSEIIDKPSSSAAKGGKKGSAKHGKKGLSPKSPKSPSKPASRNGVLSVASLTNQTDDSTVLSSSKSEGSLVRASDASAHTDPPAKRRRLDLDDGPTPNRRRVDDDDPIADRGEDLDSEDSDDQNNPSDEEAENMILAQHERVKKGPKWKVILREGIVSIRGREYLFNKATCDLDF